MTNMKDGKVSPAPEPLQIKESFAVEIDFDAASIPTGQKSVPETSETGAKRRMTMSHMIQDFDEKRKEYLRIKYTKLANLGSFDDIIIALDKETLMATDEYELRIDDEEEPILFLDDYLSSMFSYLDVAGDGYDGKIGLKQLKLLEKVFPEEVLQYRRA